MNSNDELFGTDERKESGGVWVEIRKGISYLIAAYDRPEHLALLRERLAPYRTAMAAGVGDTEATDKVMIECLADKVLLDWKGVVDRDTGAEIRYTKAEGVRQMTTHRRFREFIVEQSQRFELFRSVSQDETEKNS